MTTCWLNTSLTSCSCKIERCRRSSARTKCGWCKTCTPSLSLVPSLSFGVAWAWQQELLYIHSILNNAGSPLIYLSCQKCPQLNRKVESKISSLDNWFTFGVSLICCFARHIMGIRQLHECKLNQWPGPTRRLASTVLPLDGVLLVINQWCSCLLYFSGLSHVKQVKALGRKLNREESLVSLVFLVKNSNLLVLSKCSSTFLLTLAHWNKSEIKVLWVWEKSGKLQSESCSWIGCWALFSLRFRLQVTIFCRCCFPSTNWSVDRFQRLRKITTKAILISRNWWRSCVGKSWGLPASLWPTHHFPKRIGNLHSLLATSNWSKNHHLPLLFKW